MGSRYTVTRILEWDAGHRILRHESKCATPHGHRYKAEITVSSPALDVAGRVVDFGFLKEIVGGWIDQFWDHTTLVSRDDVQLLAFVDAEFKTGKKAPYVFIGEPSAENIAKELFEVSARLLGRAPAEKVHPEVVVENVRVWETPNCYAEWSGE